jgi:murein DD-endopeptidase MepM/ murein hydrolase activator NlpD
MQILLIPDNNGRSTKACLGHRQVVLLGVIMVRLLPALVGVLAYNINSAVVRAGAPQLDPAYVARLQAALQRQKQEIAAAKTRTETHLDALALSLGRLQAQMMRVNALGQRLTQVAGLDKGEFDFNEEPAMGGPEHSAGVPALQAPDISKSLDKLSAQIDAKLEELNLLQTLMMDKQLRAALNPVGWPVVGGYISSGFGYRVDPFNGRRAFHDGVDIADRLGAHVKAAASGVVSFAGVEPGYGLMVEINHGNGISTVYAHTKKTLVKVGEKVEKGQEIALVGSSGRSTGPHLHFEIRRNGHAINPRSFLRASR